LLYVLSVLLPVKEENMTKTLNRWLVGLTAGVLCLTANSTAFAQSVPQELASTATDACVSAAKAKGFTLKKVVSVAPKTDGATIVLSLDRAKQLFKLTCGYTKSAGAVISGEKSNASAATPSPAPVAAAESSASKPAPASPESAPAPAAAATAAPTAAGTKPTFGSAAPCKDVPAFQEKKTAALAAVDEQIAKATIAAVPTFTIIPGVTGSQSLKQEWETKKASLTDKFARYEKPGVLCGVDDGNPRLIADGRLDHAGDFIIPSILFLYVAGALGWAGRDYLGKAKGDANLEIMIDIPMALQSLLAGLLWPIQAIPQLISGSIRNDTVKP
jgi:photosystem I subunit III